MFKIIYDPILKTVKWFGISVLLVIISLPCSAQLEQVKSIEMTMDRRSLDKNFNVHVLKDNSIMLVTENSKEGNGKFKKWSFTRYDTTLNIQWQKDIDIKYHYEAIKSFDNDNFFYIFFKEKDAMKVTIARLDFHTGELDSFEGVIPTKIDDINEFKVLSNMALIAGKINQRPIIMAFRFFDKKIQVLPALYDKYMQLNNINVNEQKNIIDVVVSENNRKKK